ncbi:MAG: redoxin domain-containing protein [Candidatus Sumerlaeia bacterium]|nr:redoxin domain-containing protein [Candidatus Sumerlaeia bacterium]
MARWALLVILLFAPCISRGGDWKIAVGDPLPGDITRLLQEEVLRGAPPPRAFLINFTDCRSEPCLPLLRELTDFVAIPLADRDIRLVAIAAGLDQAAARRAVTEHETAFPLLADPDGSHLASIATPRVPLTIILDETGHVVYMHAGYRPGREAEFRYVLETLADGESLPPNLSHGEDPAGAPGHLVGGKAPDLHTPHWINPPSGEQEGKFLLVTFWATWCGPCIATKNIAEPIHARFSDRLYSVSISNEDPESVGEFVEARGWTQAIAVDPGDRTRRAARLSSFPSAYLANPDGDVIWQGHPAELWMDNAKVLESLLARD